MEIVRKIKKPALRLIRDISILFTLLVAYEVWQNSQKPKHRLPKSIASNQVLTLSGEKHFLLQNSRPTLIYVFAPWCSVCKLSSSQLEKADNEQNWNMIALASSYRSIDELIEFKKEHGLQLEVFLSSEDIDQALDIKAFPSYIIIDETGEIVHSWTGFTTKFGALIRLYFFTKIL